MTAQRVGAVVVARDRPDVVARTIKAIVEQDAAPEALILVANDASPAVGAVLERAVASHPDCEVVRLRENGGAAGGFNAGIRCALDRGDLDIACCFDDDATPLPGCLAALRAAVTSLAQVGTAGAVAHDGNGRLAWLMYPDNEPAPASTLEEVRRVAARRDAIEVAGMCFHGLMVPLDVVREHGNVRAELFHQYEDAEFGLRMRRAGLRNYLVVNAECLHPTAPPARELRVLGRSIMITSQSPAKEYLTLRNDLVVRHRYNGARFWFGTAPLILLRGLLVALSLKVPRAAALRDVFVRAVFDAARGRMGPPPARTVALGDDGVARRS